jgi:MoaA/NifB/PqqE/SkfB family radical SAM enzyme
MRAIRDYFAALTGTGPFPPVRCNAPEFSAVVGVDGRVSPCFFIPGPTSAAGVGLAAQLAGAPMVELRRAIRNGERRECERCVCSMYRQLEVQRMPVNLGVARRVQAGV